MKIPVRTTIIVDGAEWDFGRHIHDAARIDEVVVVTFVPDEGQPSILALSVDRQVLWRDIDLAHFPGQQEFLTMYNIASEDPLAFYLPAGYLLTVDVRTGQLLDTTFVK